MLTIIYAVDPTPLTKSQLASVLKICATGKAFVYALQDMCAMRVLVRYGGDRGKYQLHPSLIKAMDCKYVATPSIVNVSDALRSFSHGIKSQDEADDGP